MTVKRAVVVAQMKMWWFIGARLTVEGAVPCSNPASSTIIPMRCRIIVKNSKSQGREGDLALRRRQ